MVVSLPGTKSSAVLMFKMIAEDLHFFNAAACGKRQIVPHLLTGSVYKLYRLEFSMIFPYLNI